MFKGISISGKMGAGKTTACDEIMRNDSRFVPLSFAYDLKRIASELTGLDFFNEQVKEANRWVLQEFGTLMRKFDEDYWVKKTILRAEALIADGKIPITTDTRYVNEIEALKRIGFYCVRLDVSEAVQIQRGRVPNLHASETSLDDYAGFNLKINSGRASPEKIARAVETFGGFNGYLASNV